MFDIDGENEVGMGILINASSKLKPAMYTDNGTTLI